MTRVSADLFHEIKLKMPQGNQAYWDVMLSLGGNGWNFTLNDVIIRTNVHSGGVKSYAARLVKAGYLKITKREAPKGAGNRKKYHYTIAKRVVVAPRLLVDGSECQPQLTSYMWRTMRMLKGAFSSVELAELSSLEDKHIVTTTFAKKYILALHEAGYLKLVKVHRSKQNSTYVFIKSMDTGELAPQIMRTNIVWDRNVNKVMGAAEFSEVAA